jgi:hypothetical protein
MAMEKSWNITRYLAGRNNTILLADLAIINMDRLSRMITHALFFWE